MKFNQHENTTIASLLQEHNNDYSLLETIYFSCVGETLLTDIPLRYSVGFATRVSVIIPAYNSAKTLVRTLNSIKGQSLTTNELLNLEVLVVDDGSTDNTNEIIANYKNLPGLRYVQQSNKGRSSARNLGANLAKGDVLIFVDSDVILEPHFVREHAVRHSTLDNVVLISFKQNISQNCAKLKLPNKPDIFSDFRFSKMVKPEWLKIHRHVGNVEIRNVKIMDETMNLKNFGHNKVLGVWDLPAMVITNAVSIKKKHFSSVGGFNPRFEGWGMEDTFIGACLIALHNYIIPVFSTGIFHIQHLPRKGNMKDLIKEFDKNVLTYIDLINSPITQIIKKFETK